MSSSSNSAIDNVANALSGQSSQNSSLAASALSRGATAAQAKNYDLAIREFRRAAAYNPADPTAYSYIGKIYSMQGMKTEAIQSYKKALQIDPQSDDTKLALANAYVDNKEYNNAEKFLLELERNNPGAGEPPTTLGYIYLEQGRLAEADTQFQNVIRIAPTSATARYNLGLVRSKQEDWEGAIKQYQLAVAMDPKHENARAEMARAYLGQGDTDNARVQYRELLSMDSSSAHQLAFDVYHDINTPKILYADSARSDFSSVLGPGTSLSGLDSSLATPGASKVFKMSFAFNQEMDISSVLNPLNWTITQAQGGAAGFYNDANPTVNPNDVKIPIAPLSVTYDPSSNTATVYFRVTQNDTGTGTIDPSHWVFQFNGKDATGRSMDTKGDQYDGHTIIPF